jgi:hypothetical protein
MHGTALLTRAAFAGSAGAGLFGLLGFFAATGFGILAFVFGVFAFAFGRFALVFGRTAFGAILGAGFIFANGSGRRICAFGLHVAYRSDKKDCQHDNGQNNELAFHGHSP